ncbi:sugar transferase [Bacillus thermotolerans]|uniref:sugar transferase n=1 Tax=Bacillus thermotolerans TaxID=1221996 RepID=UPI00057D8337|nr:sugar transferase [Bacillus thermotolerans]KKB35453.1 Lipid carrier : UDP-N-acetylgalactosaminyltransferase [Bacillus thermotolerans]
MYKLLKRIMDFTLSFFALLLFSPLFLVLCLLIKMDSPGPIFFKQKRAGENDSHFMIYKFRSMRIDTPNVSTDKLGDPSIYITKVGHFLRKTSLDELPQLLNIIKGDMSIVGPRPALYNQYELIKARKKVNVHALKPGLTGYAQVKGRDFISDEEKVAYDKYYLEHMSFFFDIKIIWMTVISVVKSEGVRMNE